MIRHVVVAILVLVGCGVQPTPPPPSTVRTVAVLTPSNRTGDDLLVAGTSLLEQYAFNTDLITVPDVLATELRAALAQRGFAGVPRDVVEGATGGRPASPESAAEMARHGHLEDPVLAVAIDRWEPDAATHPAFIIVALDAALVEPSTGAVLWQTHRRASPIATPATVTLGSAHAIAAHKVAEELVAAWRVEGAAARP